MLGKSVKQLTFSSYTAMGDKVRIYYEGSQAEFQANVTLKGATQDEIAGKVYFFVDKRPQIWETNTWHYVNGEVKLWYGL